MVVPLPGEALNAADVFVFGKMPIHGDFISRGLDAGERQEWDEVATLGLDLAREQLGDGFEPQHDRAPAWRFEFGPSALCARGCAGVFAPSVDRAGRRFLIVVGARLAVAELVPAAAERVAEALEDALYEVFQSGGGVDALVQRAVAGLRSIPDTLSRPADTGPRAPLGRLWTGDPVQEIVTPRLSAADMACALTAGGT